MIPSDADLQRYARVAIFYAAGYLTAKGWDAGVMEFIGGVALFCANLAWTVYGNRVRAKLREISEIAQDPTSPIKAVILTKDEEGHELAAAIPGPVVTEGTAQARKLAA